MSETPAAHYAGIRRVLWSVLAANLAVTLLKIVLGVASGALAVVADGFHSLVDSSSNLVGLAAIRLAGRPADERHPYGYRRYETLGALAIGFLLLVAAYEIGSAIIQRLLAGAAPSITPLTVGLMLLTLPVNLLVVWLETRAGRRLNSEILLADARHTATDLYVTGAVLLSLAGGWLGWPWLDAVVAGAVVVMILRAAFQILRDTSRTLTDRATIDPEDIAAIAYGSPGVRYVHRIRSRGTPDAAFIDLHVKVDPAMSTEQAHAVASEVELRLKSQLENVAEALVHIEPARQPLSEWERMAADLRQIADGLGLGLHDLHILTDLDGRYSIELHLEIGGAVSLGEAHNLADAFEARVRQKWPEAERILTHLEPIPAQMLQTGEPASAAAAARVRAILRQHVGAAQIVDCETQSTGAHLVATATLRFPAALPLAETHAVLEKIEADLLASELNLERVTLHAEPEG